MRYPRVQMKFDIHICCYKPGGISNVFLFEKI